MEKMAPQPSAKPHRRSLTDNARERRHQRLAALQRKDKASFSQQRQQQQQQQQHQVQSQQSSAPLQPILVPSSSQSLPSSSSRRPPSPLAIVPSPSGGTPPTSPGVVGAIVSIGPSQNQYQLSPSRNHGTERGAPMGISNSNRRGSQKSGSSRPPMVSPQGYGSGFSNNSTTNTTTKNNNNIMMPVLQQTSSWEDQHPSGFNSNTISPANTPPSPPQPSTFLSLRRNSGGITTSNSMMNNSNNATTSDRSVSSEVFFPSGHQRGNHQLPVHHNNHHHPQHRSTTDRSVVSDTGDHAFFSQHNNSSNIPRNRSPDDLGSYDGVLVTKSEDIPMDERSADRRSYTSSPKNVSSVPFPPLLLPKRPNSRGPPAVMVEMHHHHPSPSPPPPHQQQAGGGGAQRPPSPSRFGSAIGNICSSPGMGGIMTTTNRTTSQDADEVSSLGIGFDEEHLSTAQSNTSPGGGYYSNQKQHGSSYRNSSSNQCSSNHNILRLIAAVQTGEVVGGGIGSSMINNNRDGCASTGATSPLLPPPAPAHFSSEERILWEAIQTAIQKSSSSSTALQQQQSLQQQSMTSTTEASTSSETSESIVSAERLQQEQEKSAEQDMALRAIRRVLADVTDERDKATTELEELRESIKSERQKWEQQLSSKSQPISASTEQQGGAASEASNSISTHVADLQQQVKALQNEKEHLNAEVDAKNKQMAKLKRHLQGSGTLNDKHDTNDENSHLRKELEGKSSALENAKMIIASLEQSSGSLASDTRFKLKAKDSEIAGLKRDAAHQQKNLDTLATELRDVQTERAKLEERLTNDRTRIVGLKTALEDNMAELCDACIILESTPDSGAMDKISDVLADAIETFKKSIDALEDPSSSSPNDMDSVVSARSMSSRASREHSGSITRDLRHELEEKNSAVRRMEEEIRRLKEDALHYRLEAERIEQQRESDKQTLYAEIQMLRVQSNTNMEVLTKKERELAVLRDSLKVEDDDVGYISDDASEGEDENDDGNALNPPSTPASMTGEYSHLQAEALATLLAHGSQSRSFDLGAMGGQQQPSQPPPSGGSPSAQQKLKVELAQARKERERTCKELKTEKESLANAKMIISSLERANKSMMEDLRSRLHDSNTAIASLLEKSMESEKSTAKLRAELESVRNEKARVEEEYEARLEQARSRRSNNNTSSTSPKSTDGNDSSDSNSSSDVLAIVAMDEKKEDIITETID